MSENIAPGVLVAVWVDDSSVFFLNFPSNCQCFHQIRYDKYEISRLCTQNELLRFIGSRIRHISLDRVQFYLRVFGWVAESLQFPYFARDICVFLRKNVHLACAMELQRGAPLQCGAVSNICTGVRKYTGMSEPMRAGLEKYTGMSDRLCARVEKYNI